MKTAPATMPVMEHGKLTKEHIGLRIVANMFSEDIKKPKRYGTIISFDNDGVLGDFGNGKAKIPYEDVDFDYCQDGWMFDIYDTLPDVGADADAKRVATRIDAMFNKHVGAPDTGKKKRGRKPKNSTTEGVSGVSSL